MVIPDRDPLWSDDDDDDDDEYEDASGDEQAPVPDENIVEIRQEEFPTYFHEEKGRLFHSSQTAPYPLPVDGHEQKRQKMMHKMLHRLLHGHYAGPVHEVLAWSTGEPGKQVLDLGTGTGKWVMDMGSIFRDVSFIGVDIVPIATQYPLRNTRFEIEDISEQLRWVDGEFDLIHARDLSMAIRFHDWPRLLMEISRLLRPGGLFISCEWASQLSVDPSFNDDIGARAPASVQFFRAVNDALSLRQVQPVASDIPNLLSDSLQFTEITPVAHPVPIGEWPPDETLSRVGEYHRRICIEFTRSVTPLLRASSLTDFDIGQLIADYTAELQNVEGLNCMYHITYARKL